MAKVTVDDIKNLRAKTSAGMALCKEANEIMVNAEGS